MDSEWTLNGQRMVQDINGQRTNERTVERWRQRGADPSPSTNTLSVSLRVNTHCTVLFSLTVHCIPLISCNDNRWVARFSARFSARFRHCAVYLAVFVAVFRALRSAFATSRAHKMQCTVRWLEVSLCRWTLRERCGNGWTEELVGKGGGEAEIIWQFLWQFLWQFSRQFSRQFSLSGGRERDTVRKKRFWVRRRFFKYSN